MSLLLLFRPSEGEAEAPAVSPKRTLLGVGLTLAAFIAGGFRG